MERSSSTASDSGFWTTIDLLIGREWRDREGSDEGDLGTLAVARKTRRPRGSKASKIGESLTEDLVEDNGCSGALLYAGPDPGRVTDRAYMHRLRHHAAEAGEEALQRRIAAREMDEMDRLKRLILSGRSPLKDCPPELRGHPVFVFWRLVNKEVEKMSKARADAYYKKLRRCRRAMAREDQHGPAETEVSSLTSCSDLPELGRAASVLHTNTPDQDRVFSPVEHCSLKYEDEGVKELRELTTVEELYHMADQIVGIPKDANIAR